ncbi:hypothetical protein B0T11DRAFT_293081 [Plectosphaerella cucumerina]|uniref:Uncharacterized protein n=1 Tax=Plectosphaerella cucumerina TaxID=40658 RepID=A0A8K0TN89_9PEZI|nr:hypothetical protein B0T11DRAFT_293081 [Plectosphaerella cucumerina]
MEPALMLSILCPLMVRTPSGYLFVYSTCRVLAASLFTAQGKGEEEEGAHLEEPGLLSGVSGTTIPKSRRSELFSPPFSFNPLRRVRPRNCYTDLAASSPRPTVDSIFLSIRRHIPPVNPKEGAGNYWHWPLVNGTRSHLENPAGGAMDRGQGAKADALVWSGLWYEMR